jgi:hypothetical protein
MSTDSSKSKSKKTETVQDEESKRSKTHHASNHVQSNSTPLLSANPVTSNSHSVPAANIVLSPDAPTSTTPIPSFTPPVPPPAPKLQPKPEGTNTKRQSVPMTQPGFITQLQSGKNALKQNTDTPRELSKVPTVMELQRDVLATRLKALNGR